MSVLRSIISFFIGLIVARDLTPSGYGNFMFLMGSFLAIRSFLDLGSSNAFFTFLSQRSRGRRFYLLYFSWLIFQFVLTLAFLLLFIPSELFERIWLTHDRIIVTLAFIAVFMQQQVWQTVCQIGEAKRMTVKVQLMNVVITLIYLIAVICISFFGQLRISEVLMVIVLQYVVAAVIAFRIFRDDNHAANIKEPRVTDIMKDYWVYCKPLIMLAFLNFAYEFADRWMLQRFGGAIQQGYFQIASQFSTISLLATTSILGIFWKEVAGAWESQDQVKVQMLYRRVNRGLFMFGAIITGYLLPWSEQIVKVVLGHAYLSAWPVLAVMLLYPIHQSMGQLSGTMFFASGRTNLYTSISVAMMLISIPVSFIVLAPSAGVWLSGFELGALGMACKMVFLGILSVNIQAWFIAKFGGWKYDWFFQLAGMTLTIGLGFVARTFVGAFWDLGQISPNEIVLPAIINLLCYIISVIAVIWWLPWLVGADRQSISKFIQKVLFGIK